MCGIFGVFSNSPVNPSLLGELARPNTIRGNLGFGGATFRHQRAATCVDVFRCTKPFDIEMVPLKDASSVLVHTRAPTGGQSDSINEIHPFETKDVLLAHNGIILNHEDFNDWRVDTRISVDSQVIAGGIQHSIDTGNGIVDSIKYTIELLEGQQACWLIDKRSATVFLWRVMSPIYVASLDPDSIVFSSSDLIRDSKLLREGIIYSIDPYQTKLEQVANFRYTNPFSIVNPEILDTIEATNKTG